MNEELFGIAPLSWKQLAPQAMKIKLRGSSEELAKEIAAVVAKEDDLTCKLIKNVNEDVFEADLFIVDEESGQYMNVMQMFDDSDQIDVVIKGPSQRVSPIAQPALIAPLQGFPLRKSTPRQMAPPPTPHSGFLSSLKISPPAAAGVTFNPRFPMPRASPPVQSLPSVMSFPPVGSHSLMARTLLSMRTQKGIHST